jgi:hypothetical protein
MERAIRAVFEPGHDLVRKVAGHPVAPMMTESMIEVMKARLIAATALRAVGVGDEALTSARNAHLFAYAEYAARQSFLAAAPPPGSVRLYALVTPEETLSNCCGHLLSTIGLQGGPWRVCAWPRAKPSARS